MRTESAAEVPLRLAICGVTALSVLVLVGLPLAHLGWLRAPVYLVLGAFSLAIGVRAATRVEVAAVDSLASVVVAVTAVMTTLVGGWFANEHLFVHRDPGIYTNTAVALAREGDLVFDFMPTFPDREVLPVDLASAGFAWDPDESSTSVFGQGSHALPVVGAAAHHLGGLRLLVRTPAVLAGLAVVLFFGLARRFSSDRAAAFVTVLSAVSVPWLWTARTMYSETLSLTLVLGGAVLLSTGVFRTSGSDADGDRGTAATLAGTACLGTALLTRLDAIALLPALLAIGMLLHRRRPLLAGVVVVASLAVARLWWFDLSERAPQYVDALDDSTQLLIRGVTLVSIAVVFVGLVAPLVPADVWRRAAAPATVLASVGPPGIVLGGVIRARTQEPELDEMLPAIAQMEMNAGLEAEGIRSYAEQAMLWHGQYLGWVTVVLGALGLSLIARRAIRRADGAALVIGLAIVPLGLLYLWDLSIFPDHPWALRRYMTTTMLLFPIGFATALDGLASLIPSDRSGWRPAVLSAISAAALVPAAVASAPAVRVVDHDGMIGLTEELCAVLPEDRTVLVSAESIVAFTSPPAVYAVCDRQVAVLRSSHPDIVWQSIEWVRDTTGNPPILLGASFDDLRQQYEFGTLVAEFEVRNERDLRPAVGSVNVGPSRYRLTVVSAR